MITFAHFVEMGGYAKYVWPAYGIVTIVLSINLITTIKKYQTTKSRLRKQFINQKHEP